MPKPLTPRSRLTDASWCSRLRPRTSLKATGNARRKPLNRPELCVKADSFDYHRTTGHCASGERQPGPSEAPEAGKLLVRGAENPSVSADGRYIAFSSAQKLVPLASGEDVQVYERDMEEPPGEKGAYTLVSARDWVRAASFAKPGTAIAGGDPGAELWRNSSISANGRYVVFRTVAVSDLPRQGSVATPSHQLFVRDLLGKTTTLLSRDAATGEPVENVLGPVLGPASISADGSTVAWVSTDAQAQTRFLLGESRDTSQSYYLWRRWQEPGVVDTQDHWHGRSRRSRMSAGRSVSLSSRRPLGPATAHSPKPSRAGLRSPGPHRPSAPTATRSPTSARPRFAPR